MHFFREPARPTDRPGSPRTCGRKNGQVSANTVAEIMAELGLQGRKLPHRRRSLTRQSRRRAKTRGLTGQQSCRTRRPAALLQDRGKHRGAIGVRPGGRGHRAGVRFEEDTH